MNQVGAFWKIVPLRMPKTLGERTNSAYVPSVQTSRPCTLVRSPPNILTWSSYRCTSPLLLHLSVLNVSPRLSLNLVGDEGCCGRRSRIDLRSCRQEQLDHLEVRGYTAKFCNNRAVMLLLLHRGPFFWQESPMRLVRFCPGVRG